MKLWKKNHDNRKKIFDWLLPQTQFKIKIERNIPKGHAASQVF
jgi:hypothetical protein